VVVVNQGQLRAMFAGVSLLFSSIIAANVYAQEARSESVRKVSFHSYTGEQASYGSEHDSGCGDVHQGFIVNLEASHDGQRSD
jgi:hypothetical protein